jgi:hypothetical protein
VSEPPFTPEQLAALKEFLSSRKPKTRKRKSRAKPAPTPRAMREMLNGAQPLEPVAAGPVDRFGAAPAPEAQLDEAPAPTERYTGPPPDAASKPGYEDSNPLDVNASIMEEAMNAKRGAEKLRIALDECRVVLQTIAAAEYDHQLKRGVEAADLRAIARAFLDSKGWAGKRIVVTTRAEVVTGKMSMDPSRMDRSGLG